MLLTLFTHTDTHAHLFLVDSDCIVVYLVTFRSNGISNPFHLTSLQTMISVLDIALDDRVINKQTPDTRQKKAKFKLSVNMTTEFNSITSDFVTIPNTSCSCSFAPFTDDLTITLRRPFLDFK